MTNPAVDAPLDGTPEPVVMDEDAAAESFLADFNSSVMGKESTSEPTERSSEPAPDAAATPPADTTTPPAAPETPSDPAAPAGTTAGDTPQYVPLTYTVNGQEKTADWALKVGDEAVVIPREHIPKFQDILQREEWQSAQNKEFYRELQQFKSALTYKDGDKEFNGLDAFRQLAADRARLDASGGELLNRLSDPQFVMDLALAYQSGDRQQINDVLAKALQQIKFVGDRAQFEALRSAQQEETKATQDQQSQERQDVEYRNIITQFGKALPSLTPDDLRAMHDHFLHFKDRIFRPASIDEARQLGVRPGEIIRDPTVMHDWAKDRAQLRQQYNEATLAASKAAKENAARTPQAPKPSARRPASPAAPKPAAAKEPRFKGDDGSYQKWKEEMMAGRFTGVAPVDD